MKLSNILTPKEVAKRFSIKEETVLGWRNQGMPCIKIGKSLFIREASLLKWIEKLEKEQNVQDASGRDLSP